MHFTPIKVLIDSKAKFNVRRKNNVTENGNN